MTPPRIFVHVRARARASSLGALLVASASLAACSPAKREAASLVSAVDRYRRAENANKPALAGVLETVACTDREVCEARDACLATSRPTTKGLLLKHEVESALSDLHAGRLSADQAGARALPSKLDEAQRLLDEGHASLSACDAKLTSLRLKYGL